MASFGERDNGALLKNLVPLNALSDELLGQLVSRIKFEKAKGGEFLFHAGDRDHRNVYLLSGRIALLSEGREMDSVSSGTNTARFALAHQWPRKFSARAEGDVTYVAIDSSYLSDLLMRSKSASYSVSEIESEPDNAGDWMSQVLRSRIFQSMPAANIQNVLRRMEEVHVVKGEVVVQEGAPGDFYYVVNRGQCVVTQDEDGQVRELARLGPGDSFGEDALLSDTPRNSTVTMATAGRLVRLSKENFIDLIKRPLTRSVIYEEACGLIDSGAVWLDIRSRASYDTWHLNDAVNVPFESLRQAGSTLKAGHLYLIYGDDPGCGVVASFLLAEQGVDVAVLKAGLREVPEAALPVGKLVPGTRTAHKKGPESTRPIPEKADREPPPSAHDAPATELARRVKELRQLKKRYDKAQVQIANLESENLGLRAETEQLRADRDNLVGELQAVRQELNEAQEILEEVSANESAQQWRQVSLEQQLEQLQHQLREKGVLATGAGDGDAAVSREGGLAEADAETKANSK